MVREFGQNLVRAVVILTYHCDTVAITRARSLLIIIGDPKVLSLDQVWNEFLHYVREMGGWRGVDFELPELDGDDDTAGPISINPHENLPATITSFLFVRTTSDGHAAHR